MRNTTNIYKKMLQFSKENQYVFCKSVIFEKMFKIQNTKLTYNTLKKVLIILRMFQNVRNAKVLKWLKIKI